MFLLKIRRIQKEGIHVIVFKIGVSGVSNKSISINLPRTTMQVGMTIFRGPYLQYISLQVCQIGQIFEQIGFMYKKNTLWKSPLLNSRVRYNFNCYYIASKFTFSM